MFADRHETGRLLAVRFDSFRGRKNTLVEILPKATHLFEEPGALEKVNSLACHWFVNHFSIK